ncbi:MAG: hypothetical protein RLZZ428_132 [Pseudomonadota bacterium]
MANHLKNEHSPYLQQHAENPVDWYPWGEEAFTKAKQENKAIFLSIGYSSCHWCHVMEKESFQNELTAKLLNQHFIAVKVDREERPDIDKHFQEVYRLMNQRPGGWPTSIFLTQELKPFYTATYIPDEPRYGMMSFSSLLEVIADRYKNEKEVLTEKANEILEFLNPQQQRIQATKLDESIIQRFISQAKQLFDEKNGGFNKAPKFPQASLLDLLLDLFVLTKDKYLLHMVLFSLTQMAKGGLRDLIDGGFCRYSTDDTWLIPHFEKMTYDNALIAQVYLKAYHVSKNDFFRSIAFETIDFMIEKMSKNGLFYSASDADSEGGEGTYFIYRYDEVIDAFTQANIPSSEHPLLLDKLHITPQGNFEGHTIIHLEDFNDTHIPYYADAINALKTLRNKKPYPFIDQKILLSWNAMMIKTLFQASRIEKRYLPQAIGSLNALLETMYIHNELYHSTLIGKTPNVKGFLEDYAYLADLLIEAHQSTLDEMYLITATKLANQAIEKYYESGKWKFSRGEFETKADIYDTSYPSAVATILWVLHGLSSLVDPVYKKFVFKTLEFSSYDIMRQPISSPRMSAMVIRYLQDDIIIKAKEKKLKENIPLLDTLPYPFTLWKNDTNDHFLLCTSHSCFGEVKTATEIAAELNKYRHPLSSSHL